MSSKYPLFLILFYFSNCSDENNKPSLSDCEKGSIVIFEKPTTFEMNRTSNPMRDTCFYWDLVNAYVIKLEIDNPNQNKPLGTIYFSNPFIVNVNIGALQPTIGDYVIEKPFVDPTKLVSNGKASMIVDGNIALEGKINFNKCDDDIIIKFSEINFVTPMLDTIYSLSGQLICKK